MKRLSFAFVLLAALVFVVTPGFSFADDEHHNRRSPYVFVLSGSGAVSVIDSRSDTVVETFNTGPGATLGCITPDGKKLYTSENAGTNVHVFDTKNLTKITEIATGLGPKHPLVSPDGKYVAVNHWGAEVKIVILDADTDDILFEQVYLQDNPSYTGKRMMHSVWTWDSRYLFIQSFPDNRTYVLETPSFNTVAQIDHNSEPHYYVPTHDSSEVWAVLQGKDSTNIMPNVDVIDVATMAIKKHIEVPILSDEVIEGHHGAFTWDGDWFVYCNRGPGPNFGGHSCTGINPDTYEPEIVLPLVNGVGHPYSSPRGEYLFMTGYGDNRLPIVDAETLNPIKTLTVGDGWHLGHIAFSHNRKKGYVSNTQDGAVYVIDMKELEVIKKIPVAAGPGEVLSKYTNYMEIAGFPPATR